MTQEYEDELRAEQSHVDDLYTRLDAERTRVKDRYDDALRNHGGTLVDRDVEVRMLAGEMQRLNVADHGLCFGRLDAISGERSYVGRIGIFDQDNEYEPLLLDWRAPASRPFYTATAASLREHAAPQAVPRPRATDRRFHRRDPRPARRRRTRWQG